MSHRWEDTALTGILAACRRRGPETHPQASSDFPSLSHEEGVRNNRPLEASYGRAKSLCFYDQYVHFATFVIL